ncbi:MAG TPA: hypothetical protein VH682_29525 [Gemmataceae bacterium]|jgi:hypothetical protein
MGTRKLTRDEIDAYREMADTARRLREMQRWAEASEIDLAAAVRRRREAQRRARALRQRRKGGSGLD